MCYYFYYISIILGPRIGLYLVKWSGKHNFNEVENINFLIIHVQLW